MFKMSESSTGIAVIEKGRSDGPLRGLPVGAGIATLIMLVFVARKANVT